MNLRRSHGSPAVLGRSARAYIAGFGTTGSLLAGAALMFIVASALVAFRGWPHVATQPAPAEVVISPQRAASTSGATLATRRLAFAAAVPAVGAGARAGGRAPPPTGAVRGLGRAPTTPTGPPQRTTGAPASTAAPVGTPTAPVSTGSSTAPPSPPPPSPTPIQRVKQAIAPATNALGTIAANTGAKVGTTVQQTTNTVAGAVGGSSTPVGGAVNGAGTGAAQTVTGVTNALGGLVSGLGH